MSKTPDALQLKQSKIPGFQIGAGYKFSDHEFKIGAFYFAPDTRLTYENKQIFSTTTLKFLSIPVSYTHYLLNGRFSLGAGASIRPTINLSPYSIKEGVAPTDINNQELLLLKYEVLNSPSLFMMYGIHLQVSQKAKGSSEWGVRIDWSGAFSEVYEINFAYGINDPTYPDSFTRGYRLMNLNFHVFYRFNF